jgi:hypothetical protein
MVESRGIDAERLPVPRSSGEGEADVSPEKQGHQSWLVVGHGSVGSLLTERFASRGDTVFVCDPSPRIPLGVGQLLDADSDRRVSVDCVVSCVSPSAAEDVPALATPFVGPRSLFFDWNSVAPAAKQRVAGLLPCDVIDVALLDSIDGLALGAIPGPADSPSIAISGPRVQRARALLATYGFEVEIAGSEVGAAAMLKYTRSIFMKSLEALVLEYLAIAETIDGDGIVWRSLERNLGSHFARFMTFLLTTNRLHAERRAAELADAVEVFSEQRGTPKVASAAVDVLSRAAELWKEPGAPPEHASPAELAGFLSRLA